MKHKLKRALFRLLPYRWLNGSREFHRFLDQLESFERLSPDAAREWQFRRVRELVGRAHAESPFYSRFYRRHDFHPDQLRHVEDLRRVPVISKADIVDAPQELILSSCRDQAMGVKSTSGSTGQPLHLPLPYDVAVREQASMVYLWRQVGYRPERGRVEFRGNLPQGQLYLHDPRKRMLRLNATCLEREFLPQLLAVLRHFRYQYFHGFPSTMAHFAELLHREGKVGDLPHPAAILCSSEVLTDFHRHTFASCFPESTVFNLYGQAERVAAGSWTAGSEAIHFLARAYHVEIDPRTKEVIGTNLHNDTAPLIRYNTRDVAGEVLPVNPRTPWLFPVVSDIEGRIADRLVNSSGGYVSTVHLVYAFRRASIYSACKIIQHETDRFEILVVPTGEAEQVRADFELVKQDLLPYLGQDARIEIRLVDHIPLEANGKFKWIESRLETSATS